jgi:hypothetical protein
MHSQSSTGGRKCTPKRWRAVDFQGPRSQACRAKGLGGLP